MSVKPGLLPISPKDARSAIRLKALLESDIARLKQDLKRRVCDPVSARAAISMKERKLNEVNAFMRQYYISSDTYDRQEAERRRQAERRQHAMFETQRKAGVPVKGSPEQKAAVHAEVIESTSPPPMPASVSVPPSIPERVEYSNYEFTSTPQMTLLRLLEESTEINDVQFIKPLLPPQTPFWLSKQVTTRELALMQQMLERLYRSRKSYSDQVAVHNHLVLVYEVAQVPQTQRIPVPTPPQEPTSQTTTTVNAATTLELERVRQEQMRIQAELEAAKALAQRGSQAAIEQAAAAQAKADALARQQAEMNAELIRIEQQKAKAAEKKREEQVEAEKKAAHEKQLALENQRRAEEQQRQEAELKRQEEERLRQQRLAQEAKARAEEESKRAELMEAQRELQRLESAVFPLLKDIEMIEQHLKHIETEMEHSKVQHPEIMQDLQQERTNVINDLTILKRQAAPYLNNINELKKIVNQGVSKPGFTQEPGMSGLRSWYKNLFTKKSVRKIPDVCAQMLREIQTSPAYPPDVKERAANLRAQFLEGKDINLHAELSALMQTQMTELGQRRMRAAALAGTPTHVKHGKSSIASNNYNRLRSLQVGEEIERSIDQSTQAVADEKTQLAGMFPKLRDSVTRMVGH
mgnify:CR=1 FL=1